MEVSEVKEGEFKKELLRIKKELDSGKIPREFWKIVNEARKRRLSDEELKLIAEIDNEIFKRKHRIRIGVRKGIAIAIALNILAISILFLEYSSKNALGLRLIMVSIYLTTFLHNLVHYSVGMLLGIEFNFFFFNAPTRVEPSLKVDYASYLRVKPLRRFIFHVSAPFVTSFIIPLLFFILAFLLEAPSWTKIVLAIMLLFDIISEFTGAVAIEVANQRKILGMDVSKTDMVRALREWKIYKSAK